MILKHAIIYDIIFNSLLSARRVCHNIHVGMYEMCAVMFEASRKETTTIRSVGTFCSYAELNKILYIRKIF